jgi:hypothetical protein
MKSWPIETLAIRRGERGGERLGVAGLLHRRDQHRAGRRAVRHRRARRARHHEVRADQHLREAAGDAADEDRSEVHESPRDAALLHEEARQHEERQRKERERVEDRHHALPDDYHRQVRAGEQREHGGRAHRHGDRHAEEHQQQEGADQDAEERQAGRAVCRAAFTKWSTLAAPPSTAAA